MSTLFSRLFQDAGVVVQGVAVASSGHPMQQEHLLVRDNQLLCADVRTSTVGSSGHRCRSAMVCWVRLHARPHKPLLWADLAFCWTE